MNDAAYFARLFDYDSAMNRQVLELLRARPDTDERTRRIFAHLLQANRLWLRRISGREYMSMVIWPELSWEECGKLIDEEEGNWREYLNGLSNDDLSRIAVYNNSKGEEFRTPVRDILTHVLIHGGYHRGQVAYAVRSAGGEPINTDYITYTRINPSEPAAA